MGNSFVYQVFYNDYEGVSELIDTFGSLDKAKNLLKEEAAQFQEEIMEPPTRVEEMGIYFDDAVDGYDYWFDIKKVAVK